MKKTTYLFAILSSLLIVSCGGQSNNPDPNTFSFQNVKLDLSSVSEIGVYRNEDAILNNEDQHIETTITNSTLYSYLVGYNNQDQLIPLKYFDLSGNEIQIPFSVYSIEVKEEFSFIVYFYQGWGYPQFEINKRTSPDSLFFTDSIKSRTWQKWVILHNESGSLIDTAELFEGELRFIQAFNKKVIYFTYDESNGTCKTELGFNTQSGEFLKSQPNCTSLSIYPLHSHRDGGFIYQIENGGYNYASSNLATTRELEFTPFTKTFKTIGDNIVAVSNGAKEFFTLSSDFNIIEEFEISVVYEDDDWKDRSENWGRFSVEFLFYFNGEYYFNVVGQIVKVNYDLKRYEISNDFSGTGDFVLFENNVFQLKNNQILHLKSVFEFEIIEDSYNTINNLSNYSQTGYLSYYQVSGLSQINKYLNLQTGEIYLESESRPTITVTQVQPIN